MKTLLLALLASLSLSAEIISLDLERFNIAVETAPYFIAGIFQNGCYPCKKAKGYIMELEKRYGDEVLFGIADYDLNQELADELRVRAFPSLYFYREGEPVAFHGGPITKELLEHLMEFFIEGKTDNLDVDVGDL